MRRFSDRREAGRALAEALGDYADQHDVVVLALPHGGVPVAHEVARALGATLDILLVRKLGVPGHEELGFGALASGGVRVLNDEIVRAMGIDRPTIERVSDREAAELDRQDRIYRGDRTPRDTPRDLAGATVILVDDGLATGSTMRVAVAAAREQGARRIIVGVPTGAPDTCAALRAEVDAVVCLTTPDPFEAVGLWYEDFRPTTESEVRELLAAATERRPGDGDRGPVEPRPTGARVTGAGPTEPRPTRPGDASPEERQVSIPADLVSLEGDLAVPAQARGVVVFAHGSGSSRRSPRNRFVAEELRRAGLATLLMDLLTEREEAVDLRTGALRFDVELLAGRLVAAVDWLASARSTSHLPIGAFGASTGAAAAILAAARRSELVRAVVSRGGRPDLAGDALRAVTAPTLLIVGAADPQVLQLNREAADAIHVEKRLEVVPDATHLFEEPGALERVAELARAWFVEHLAEARTSDGERTERPSDPAVGSVGPA